MVCVTLAFHVQFQLKAIVWLYGSHLRLQRHQLHIWRDMKLPWYDDFFREDYARFDDHPETGLEVEFLSEILKPGGAILDLGCGAGRHAARLSEAGYLVVGLDRSEVMLTCAVARGPGGYFIRGDSRNLPVRDSVLDGVISMFSSIGYFEDESANYRTFAEMARVLKPGGRLVIETVNLPFLIRHAPPQTWFDQGGLHVMEERWYDPVTCRSEVDVIVVDDAGATRNYHHSIRLYGAAELAMLLASVGIDTLDVFGDFERGDLDVNAPRMILVGECR
jgi:SAM-dependent methyltransferase